MRACGLLAAASAALLELVGCSSSTAGSGGLTAEDLVTDKRAKLVFEVDAVQGMTPNASALEDFRQVLEQLRQGGYLGKPDGIEIVFDQSIPPPTSEADHAYTSSELQKLGDKYRSYRAAADVAVVQLLYVDGHSAEDDGSERILGVTFGHDRVVMFRKTIDAESVPTAGRVGGDKLKGAIGRSLEASVLVHESGHLFGLVNDGTDMVAAHQDTPHGHHDTNEACVMFYQAEKSSFAKLISDRVAKAQTAPPTFDDACLDDLKAAQKK